MYDYHVHTDFSDDGFASISEIIDTAIEKGIKEIAITDHYDPDYPDPDFPFDINFISYHNALLKAEREYKDRIKILKGIEIGIQHGETLIKCEKAANAFPYDIVLGSFHTICGDDLYSNYFTNRNAEEGVRDYYVYMADCLKIYKNFDILGHINVIDRYAGHVPDYSPYMEIIESILRMLIENGKGIETNASGAWYGMGERTMPSKEILKLYKDLGGEIITIGSDAHKVSQIGYGYNAAVESLKSHGFKYICTFEGRKHKFVKI